MRVGRASRKHPLTPRVSLVEALGLRRPRTLAGLRRRPPPTPFAAATPSILPAPPATTALAQAVDRARWATGAGRIVVQLAAAEESRVRKVPALLVNAVLFFVALDLGGSLYLREATGVKLFERYREGLVPPTQSLVVDSGSRRLGTYATPEAVREPIDHLPAAFQDALVRWEDARFYAHDGVDRYRIVGALWQLFQGVPQGGSTITMQLAKLVKRDSARTLRRKLEDIALALALDHRLGKQQVLLLYANQAYFGSGVYGLGQACRYYFEREKCEGLTLDEAAYLVSLLRAPAELSRDEARARARRDAVLEQLREPAPVAGAEPWWDRVSRELFLALHVVLDHELAGRNELGGRYPDARLDEARATPLRLARHRPPPTHPFVLETARQELQRRVGGAIYDQGLEVRLTIDTQVQDAAEHALDAGLAQLRKWKAEKGDTGLDDLDGGLVVIDPRTGALLAYVPGADFRVSQVPFAARPIQVGSSLKPFVYAELFEQGRGDLDTLVPDAPICIGGWCPRNYDGKYRGQMTVRDALGHSINTVAVRVAQKVGVDSIAARLRLLGVTSPLTVNLPMALGASELTLLELGGLYGALFDGHVVRPHLVREVRDRDGELLFTGGSVDRPRGLQARTLEMLHEAMAGVVSPGGTASAMGRDLEEYFGLPKDTRLRDSKGRAPQLACKTGTHDGFTRAGLGCVVSDTDFGPIAIVTYVGHRLPRGLGDGLTGGRIAGPIVGEVVKALTQRTRGLGVFRPFPRVPHEFWEDPAPTPDPLVGAPLDVPEKVGLEVALAAREELDAARVRPAAEPTPDVPDEAASAARVELVSTGLPEQEVALPAQLRLGAPRDWRGLRVLDTSIVEASAPDLVGSFLDHGGREDELAELAPWLALSIEERVVHRQRLLAPGFTDKRFDDRLLLLGERVTASFLRMLDERQTRVSHESPDPLTHVIAEADGDRRMERVFHLAHALKALRVTRHHATGTLLSVEVVDAEGARRAWVRRGDRLAPLTSRRVVVASGSLEPAWLAAGMNPSQLDGLRSLVGDAVDIDRIPRNFAMDLLLADGGLVGAELEVPTRDGRDVRHFASVRTEGACVATTGMPCGGRLLPLPMAEARSYNARGAARSGPTVVQREVPGSIVVSPVQARVSLVEASRGLVLLATDDDRLVRLDGLAVEVVPDAIVGPGTPLGRLDVRGSLVVRTYASDVDGSARPLDVIDTMNRLGQSDEALRGVVHWWRELHAWLRGERPDLRHDQIAPEPS